MLKKLKVRRGAQSQPTKKFDGTKEFATTDSMDGSSVLPETQFFWTRLCVDDTWVLSEGGSLPTWELPVRGQSLSSNSL